MYLIKKYRSAIVPLAIILFLFGMQGIFLECSHRHVKFNFESKFQNFDVGWRFNKDSLSDAKSSNFDDSQWRILDLPHDWSIEDLLEQIPGKTTGPFSIESGGPRNGMSNGHTVGGTGWYRKKFALNTEDRNKQVALYFEGAYTETDVWVNGQYVGNHKHGYTSFYFDITPFCHQNSDSNVVAVRVRNFGENSRWYSGSGIYRHVKLVVTNPTFIGPWSVYITTPIVSETEAWVQVSAELTNKSEQEQKGLVKIKLWDADNRVVADAETEVTIPKELNTNCTQSLKVNTPKLWSIENPNLYVAEVSVWLDGKNVDATQANFGIRTIGFSSKNGFQLNGKALELKGGCVHHDNGILGAAAYDRAEERKVELLKSHGFNAVRSSHYPPSEKFLEACDRLGMLVIDESFDMWQLPKNIDDYHQYFDSYWESDVTSIVKRDRNHPSVILWSIGNEIEERADSSGIEITKKLIETIKQLDSIRPIIEAVNEFWDHPGRKWEMTAPAFELLDVCGYNYQWWQYEPDHQQFPNRIMVGTESVPKHAFENWQLVEKHPYVIGDFVWTAMDYLGESGLGHADYETDNQEQLKPWPWFNAYCGDIDLIGNKKPQSFYHDVLWQISPVEMAVHAPLAEGCTETVSYWGWPDEQQSWTWPGHEGELFDVNVYSRASKVVLQLNGKTIDEKPVSDSTRFTASFKVRYQPGELKALAYNQDKLLGEVSFKTATRPAKLKLIVDRPTINADGKDLAFVSVEVQDVEGYRVPDAAIPLVFSAYGAGEILAVGNANPSEMASFKQPKCKTFQGSCLVIIRSKKGRGNISLKVIGAGLEPASISIDVR